MKIVDASTGVTAPQSLTSKNYWDRTWTRATDNRRRAQRLRRLESLDWQLSELLVDSARRAESINVAPRVLELGCANSIWLPYLGRELDADVTGVDFSERGCRLAEQNLAATGLSGTIVCDDFFNHIRSSPASFDLVISFGVIEHFADVTAVLAAVAASLKPGGMLVATVPNLVGIYGPVQRLIDDQVLAQHVMLTPDALAAHGRAAGLVDVSCGYVGGPLRLSSLNFAHIGWLPRWCSLGTARMLFEIDCIVSTVWRRARRHTPRSRTAPYIFLRGVAGAHLQSRGAQA